MNKKNESKERNSVVRRNHSALRDSKVKVTINKANDEESFSRMLSMCKTQASVAQLCIESQKSIDFTEDLLVSLDLCKTKADAHKRVKRHIKYDKSTRIVKRALHMCIQDNIVTQ